METSRSILHLGIHCLPRSHRNHCRNRADILQTSRNRLLSVQLRILPVRFLLRVLLGVLPAKMALLALEVGLFTPLLGLELRRPRLLHPKRTIRAGRNHQRPVRPDDARPTTARPSSLERRTLVDEGQFLSSPFPLYRVTYNEMFGQVSFEIVSRPRKARRW